MAGYVVGGGDGATRHDRPCSASHGFIRGVSHGALSYDLAPVIGSYPIEQAYHINRLTVLIGLLSHR